MIAPLDKGGAKRLLTRLSSLLTSLVFPFSVTAQLAISTTPKSVGFPSTTQPGETLVLSGLSTVLERPKPLWSTVISEEEFICFHFFIHPIGRPVSRVQVTSSGIGGALLLDGVDPTKSCENKQRIGTNLIALSNLDSQHGLELIVPTASFSDIVGGAKGKLILARPGLPVIEFALALRREDYTPPAKAFLWFLGVAVPAILASAIALIVYWAQKRIDSKQAENDALDHLRRDSAPELKTFFEGLYKTTMKLPDGQEFSSTMERELGQLRILSALPQKRLERLMDGIRRAKRQQVANELASAFPDYRDLIAAPTKHN
jgi:hypothetical protein